MDKSHQGHRQKNTLNPSKELQQMRIIKITENYPLKVNKKMVIESTAVTRSCTMGQLTEAGCCNLSLKACVNDATRLWLFE